MYEHKLEETGPNHVVLSDSEKHLADAFHDFRTTVAAGTPRMSPDLFLVNLKGPPIDNFYADIQAYGETQPSKF